LPSSLDRSAEWTSYVDVGLEPLARLAHLAAFRLLKSISKDVPSIEKATISDALLHRNHR
jgi:hypothetical protein